MRNKRKKRNEGSVLLNVGGMITLPKNRRSIVVARTGEMKCVCSAKLICGEHEEII